MQEYCYFSYLMLCLVQNRLCHVDLLNRLQGPYSMPGPVWRSGNTEMNQTLSQLLRYSQSVSAIKASLKLHEARDYVCC